MILKENRWLLLGVLLLLYVLQGCTVGLFFFALPSWQAMRGSDATGIAAVASAAGLPWAFKLIAGLLMDRYNRSSMGRRRPWLIGLLLLGAVASGIVAVIAPVPEDIATLAGFAFVLNMIVAAIDVATDGLAIDLVPEEVIGRANGFMFGGQAVGVALGTVASGAWLVQQGLGSTSGRLAIFFIFMLFLLIVLREWPGDSRLSLDTRSVAAGSADRRVQTFNQILRALPSVFSVRRKIVLLTAGLLMGCTGGLFRTAAPIAASHVSGWTTEDYTRLSGVVSLASGLLGILVFGWVVERLVPRKAFAISFLLVGIICVVALAFLQKAQSAVFVSTLVLAILPVKAFGAIAFAGLAMRSCMADVVTTEFATYMAAASLGIPIGSIFVAPLLAVGGIAAILVVMLIASLVGFWLLAQKWVRSRPI